MVVWFWYQIWIIRPLGSSSVAWELMDFFWLTWLTIGVWFSVSKFLSQHRGAHHDAPRCTTTGKFFRRNYFRVEPHLPMPGQSGVHHPWQLSVFPVVKNKIRDPANPHSCLMFQCFQVWRKTSGCMESRFSLGVAWGSILPHSASFFPNNFGKHGHLLSRKHQDRQTNRSR